VNVHRVGLSDTCPHIILHLARLWWKSQQIYA